MDWDASSALTEDGSTGSEGNYVDATAPYSPDRVARFVYPTGLQDGFVGQYSVSLGAGTVRVYSCCYVKFTSNFRIHPSNLKFWYTYRAANQTSASNVWGFLPDGDPITGGITVNAQPQTTNGPQLVQSADVINRDEWFLFETLQVMNTTTGTSDGIARAWVNGTQVLNATNMRFSESGDALEWRMHNLDPYYGGAASGAIPATCDLRVDQLLVASSTSRT